MVQHALRCLVFFFWNLLTYQKNMNNVVSGCAPEASEPQRRHGFLLDVRCVRWPNRCSGRTPVEPHLLFPAGHCLMRCRGCSKNVQIDATMNSGKETRLSILVPTAILFFFWVVVLCETITGCMRCYHPCLLHLPFVFAPYFFLILFCI